MEGTLSCGHAGCKLWRAGETMKERSVGGLDRERRGRGWLTLGFLVATSASCSSGQVAPARVSAGGTGPTTGTGMVGGAGVANGGSGGSDQPPVHVVRPCNMGGSAGEATVGTWENVTPAGIPENKSGDYGSNAFVINPRDTSMVYQIGRAS